MQIGPEGYCVDHIPKCFGQTWTLDGILNILFYNASSWTASHKKKKKKKETKENDRKLNLHLKEGNTQMKWLRFHTEHNCSASLGQKEAPFTIPSFTV